MSQISLAEWVQAVDDAGLLRRYSDEKRVDELPQLMEGNPDKAIFVERVKDCAFPFFANGLQTPEICALALGCQPRELSAEIGRRSMIHYPAKLVGTAPCQDVVMQGDDVDLTVLPLFLHHTHDGQAYINNGRIITRDPETGDINDGIQRLMYRSKDLLSIDMRAANHQGAINGAAWHALKKDMPVAVCVGGPTLDQISSMMRVPGARIDGWDKLGGFLGGPAEVVRCETVDLTVPANAEIVLEGHVLTSEGFIHDEGPYGEATGTYGVEWLGHNWNLKVDCVTYRRNAIYQHASIGGLHPGRTDMYIWLPAIEGDLFETLQRAGVHVLDVHLPPGSCENIAYARIRPVSGGDAKQALAVMLTGSHQQFPKVAYVFDEDIDIYDEEQVKWAQAFRYNPGTGTLLIPGQNINPLDPSITMKSLPVSITKIGLDCTMPLGQDNAKFERAVITPRIGQPAAVEPLSEDEIEAKLRELIQQSPRSWREIVTYFAGQPYQRVYRAFGRLRPQLGRVADQGPDYPYTFAGTEFVHGTGNG
jgi:4-hydroxy-3-polyprenylbenzoate decarboxylase